MTCKFSRAACDEIDHVWNRTCRDWAGRCLCLVAHGKSKRKRCNELANVIVPYKYEGLWVFDDAAVGLSKEPFIAGIDTLIDKATASIPDAQHGFRAIFSGTQFP